MRIFWSTDAIEMADAFLEESKYVYGLKVFQKHLDKIKLIIHQLEKTPRSGPYEEALSDEEGEFRFRLINDRFKLVYRIIDEQTLLIIALWDMRMNPEKLRLFVSDDGTGGYKL